MSQFKITIWATWPDGKDPDPSALLDAIQDEIDSDLESRLGVATESTQVEVEQV